MGDKERDNIIRGAVGRRMQTKMMHSGGSHDPYSVQMEIDPRPRADSSPYHPLLNPFPAPDPEWTAGSGKEEMLVSIFVYHPQSQNTLWDNPLFIIQSFETIIVLLFGFIGLLMMTDTIAINNYIFIIALSIIFAVTIMIHFLSMWYWAKQPRFSHKHNNEIQFPFFFWIALYIAVIVIIGRWLDTIPGGCCEFSDSQPDKTDLASYNRFIAAYTVLTISSLFLVYPLSRALLSHCYPEGRYVPSFYNTRSSDIYIDEIDEPEELKVLTSAPGKGMAGGKSEQTYIPRGVRKSAGPANAASFVDNSRNQPNYSNSAAVVFPRAHGTRQPR